MIARVFTRQPFGRGVLRWPLVLELLSHGLAVRLTDVPATGSLNGRRLQIQQLLGVAMADAGPVVDPEGQIVQERGRIFIEPKG